MAAIFVDMSTHTIAQTGCRERLNGSAPLAAKTN